MAAVRKPDWAERNARRIIDDFTELKDGTAEYAKLLDELIDALYEAEDRGKSSVD